MKVDWVALGEVLVRAGNPAAVDPTVDYPTLGVKSHARGAFDSGVLHGSQTAYASLTQVHEGWIVYPKLMAWEGALALVPADLNGHWVTPEFVSYEISSEALNLDFLRHLIAWPGFLERVRAGSSGTNVRRRRLQPAAFEAITVPLPPRCQQDRIASHLGGLSHGVEAATSNPADLVDPVVAEWLDTLPSASLSELAEVCPRPQRVEPDKSVDFVPMDAVDATTGSILSPLVRARGELTSGYRQFLPGDVIFARITPCMQNGKSAIYRGNFAQVGYGSTEFHVIRPRDDRYTEWLWALLRTGWFIKRAMDAFTGTAGQQRVPASFLERATIPVPPISDVAADTRRLIQLRDRVNELTAVLRRREHLSSAVLPAARNEIFNSMR